VGILVALLVVALGVALARRGPDIGLASFPARSAPPDAAVLVGAGDIGDCGTEADEATARLVESIEGTVFAAGDTAYDRGTLDEFARCYAPTWGRVLSRTLPAVGNHEYETAGAAGYFAYYGPLAGTPGEGWYARDVGTWRVYVLNSNCGFVPCGAGSPQLAWLESELRDRPARCSLAIWHHPFVSSADRESDARIGPLWAATVEGGVDIVVTGHDHFYERFAPLGVDGDPAADGTRLFIVGTGGRLLDPFGAVEPGSEARDASTYGVIAYDLGDGFYRWRFLPAAGGTFTDSGEGTCR
jgi:hypothetical protein